MSYDDQRRQEAVIKKFEKEMQLIVDGVYAQLLSSAEGRLFLHSFLSRMAPWQTVIGSDTHMTYLNEGRRQEGIRLFSDLTRVNPNALALLMKEAQDRENDFNARNNRNRDDELDNGNWDRDDELEFDFENSGN